MKNHLFKLIALNIVMIMTSLGQSGYCREVDMKPHWNDKIPLENPHKGWYHHYPDNHINKYEIKKDEHLLDFPGMDHVYIRLAWAYLEPEEGRYNWDVIDSIINKWTQHGLGIAFRISCKETSTDLIEQQFATPRWVKEAGAKGDYYRRGEKAGPDGPWEPVFDDPVYLEKLENFLRAFANRYDGKPWLRYVDIGSIGDWGEGHTHSGSRIAYDYNQRLKHIDLHCKYFKKSQLTITDDFVYSVDDKEDQKKMHQYVLDKGISYRDDSILVNGYLSGYSDQYTVRSPQFFADSYLRLPNVLELEHYSIIRRMGNWFGTPDSNLKKYGKGKTGADMFKGALKLLHASYIGYHGDANDWLSENRELSNELLNQCGYWYFLHNVTIPDALTIGQQNTIQMQWENRGAAPAYNPYSLIIRLEGSSNQEFTLDSHNQKWRPSLDETYKEDYSIQIPASLKTGTYKLKIKLYDNDAKRDVILALDPNLMDKEKFYFVADIMLN